jgi:hypothetical protein
LDRHLDGDVIGGVDGDEPDVAPWLLLAHDDAGRPVASSLTIHPVAGAGRGERWPRPCCLGHSDPAKEKKKNPWHSPCTFFFFGCD